jgi:hypothetical protein
MAAAKTTRQTTPSSSEEPRDLLARLSRRFRAEQVEKRDGFHYVSIDSTINRANEVLGFGWSLKVDRIDVEPTGNETRSGKPIFRAVGVGHVTVFVDGREITRAGSGSNESFDVDVAVKATQAEILKKGFHQFGVGLNLWSADERALVDAVQEGNLKKGVQILARIEGAEMTAEGIAGHFGVKVDDLQDETVLSRILAEGGLL